MRFLRKRVAGQKSRRPLARRTLVRRMGMIEQLEDRRLLTVSQELVSQLSPYQNALNTALDVASSLPLVGKQLADLQKWNTVFQDSVASLASRVDALTDGHFEMAVPLPSFSSTFTFDLGLDAFLQVKTAGGVSAAINPVLNVGFNLTNGVPSLDATHTGLDINFAIGLPNFELTASLNGFLYAKAVDAGTAFTGKLGFVFDTGFHIQSHFAGDAHVRLALSLSLVDPALNASFNPRFSTDFELDWGFDTQGDQLKGPQIAFRHFSLDADSFMHGFLGDTVKAVQKFTRPLQPFIDMFEQPVPILSSFDSSETMGDLFLKGAGLSAEQQDSFGTMIKIAKAVNSFDFAGSTGGAVINFGDINLTGDARVAGQFLFDTSALDGVIDDIMNSPVLQGLEDKLETLADYAGFNADAGFKYPVLEKPGPVIGSLLTGQPEVMFSYATGRQHFELGASVGVGIPDVLGVFLEAGLIFDANLSVGYDTAGLIKFVQDPLKRPADLLHGFYIDNGIDTSGPPIPGVPNPRNTAVYLQGFAGIKASAGVTVSGGIYADINMELASSSASTHVYLDDIITGLASNTKVFNPSGKLYASAKIELTLPNPVGPDITLFEHQISYLELLNFNVPRPPTATVPVTVIDVTNQHSLLLDVTKMTAGGFVKVQPFHDLSIASGSGFLGDGIRVDYPNEIVLYVERKNDVTTNYYNFIGLSGTVPDGISIDIVDPFSVFSDEGVPDPQPAQTESGVLLAGGRSVVYNYRESIGGSQATVLMIGGYGSNTLNGGTMLFGNFIPAARLGQAKAHFGNISGYDAATQAYINARLDSMQAPASPTGIIGSTLTGRRGGLMFGGPGNNSFFAEGAGNYEMVGGAWTNSFTISPSFGGARATYQIDGGPYGKSTLVVRVPLDENVGFENSNVDDKYDPAFKALAVTANAGLSATAHGIHKVQIVAKPGASVTIGDTSLINAEFSITGGAQLTFGGTNAPDVFSVVTSGPFHGLADHQYPWRVVTQTYTEPDKPANTILFGWGIMPSLPLPVYSVTRTFGTNGRTQTIPFAVGDAKSSSITLNAGGASDSYSLDVGLGAFIDVAIKDSDTASVNPLSVSTGDTSLFYNKLNFTDTTVELDYYTYSYVWSSVTEYNTYYPYTTTYYMTSVHYTPTVTFSSNVAPKVRTGIPFQHITINRPVASQSAELFVGGAINSTTIPYAGLSFLIGAWDVYTNPWTRILPPSSGQAGNADILANGGSFLITQGVTTPIGFNPTTAFNVLDNKGALRFVDSGNAVWSGGLTVNVVKSSGSIDILESSFGYEGWPYASANVNIGATGTLASITGTISISSVSGLVNLKIDDRSNMNTTNAWQVFSEKTLIGNLTINHAVNSYGSYPDQITRYEAFPKAGSLLAYEYLPRFHTALVDGEPMFSELVALVGFTSARRGEAINQQLSALSNTPGLLTFSATGLPPGLTISSSGLISGTISSAATQASYTAQIQVTRGTRGRITSMTWDISSAIQISVPSALSDRPQVEGTAPPIQPLTATNLFNRPVTFSATNLPPGITLNSATGRFGGTYAAGIGQNGYYVTTFLATDGVDTASYQFYWFVTGITLNAPGDQFNRLGDVVSLPISYSVASGVSGTITVSNLPDGLIYDSANRRITGIISPNATRYSYVNIAVEDGRDYRESEFVWLTLPANVSNFVDFNPMGDKYLHEGEQAFILPSIYNSLKLPITLTATGLPPGLTLGRSEGDWIISGTVAKGAAAQSPYHVQLRATDGVWSDTAAFDISVGLASTVAFYNNDYTQYNAPYDIIGTYIVANSSLGETITYSATGLPPGLAIDPDTGLISGDVPPHSAVPTSYKVTVTATTASGSDQTKFNWNFIGSFTAPNEAVVGHPNGLITVTSPAGTELQFATKKKVNATVPASDSFPLGYFEFTIRGLEPGQSADLTMTGLDLTGINDYLNYGATPANANAHWYKFLFGQATDADNAVGTGMEIVDGKLVLHMVDGGRGDTDRTLNGVVSSLGGPGKKVSQPPVISNFGGTATFTENGSPVILDNDVTITDPDSANFADGKLTVVTAVNAESTDRIRVRHTGNAAGQIGVEGFNINYEGRLIGTFTGASSLVVRLNANATPAAVQALLRNVTYAAVTESPSSLNRTMRVTLTDGDGGTSATVTGTVSVIAVNDRPVIGAFAGTGTYTENGDPLILDSDATVSDVDSPNFDTGKLTVAIISNAESTDRIRVKHVGNAPGQIGVSGTTISYGGTAIGTFTGATALVITFNSQATPAAVQALLRQITYFTVSDTPATLNRTVRVYVTDGDGGTSTLSYKTVQVVAVNDAPTIGSFGSSVKYSASSAPILITTTATVTDNDSQDFNTGVLTIATTQNVQATDLLAILHQGSGAGQIGVTGSTITFEGRAIGIQTGGAGSTALTVTLNANATATAVQALLRSVTWRNTQASPAPAVRKISVTLSDGDGGLSSPLNKQIEIVL